MTAAKIESPKSVPSSLFQFVDLSKICTVLYLYLIKDSSPDIQTI